MNARRLIGLFAAVAAMGLAACTTVGPNYHVPETAVARTPAAEAPFIGAAPAIAADQPVPDAWWRLYRDPELDTLIHDALAANTELRVAEANIGRAEAALRLAKDARKPETSISGGVERARLSGEAYLLDTTLPEETLYDLEFQATWQLDLFGQIRRGIEAARADDDSVRAARDAVRVTVAAETARAYAEACGAGADLALAHHLVDLQRQGATLTARLVAGGRAGSTELTRSQGQVALSQASIPALEARQRLALYRLATLTGRPPSEYPREVEKCAEPPRVDAVIPVGDGAALIRRRPDIREAERRLAADTARVGVATGDLYPKVALGLGLGSTGALSDFLKPATDSYSLGPLISWTFPNRSAARARIEAAKAGAAGDFARFDGAVLGALREVESALSVYGHDLDRERDLKAARARAATALADATTLQRAGRQTVVPVLEAERAVTQIDQALADLDDKVCADQIALFLALGGGWQPDAAAKS